MKSHSFLLSIAFTAIMLACGCSSVSDPETMKTPSTKQAENDTNDASSQKTAQNQRSTSGRVLAAGSHITGAMFGG